MVGREVDLQLHGGGVVPLVGDLEVDGRVATLGGLALRLHTHVGGGGNGEQDDPGGRGHREDGAARGPGAARGGRGDGGHVVDRHEGTPLSAVVNG